ncbi:YeeE/YedE family protein [uncultured Microbulbifer sp.]|uniref:YeeE/YedE family protein n=1 Tax=uncultured Microbulbifer sp. TaxID=348147 RepID=UPI00260DCDA6|nr:YeeE/YedE family protein [uncultured Microbulbifer sp.]
MKTTVTALLAGLIFGLGLLLSGMANPEKVLGFLDITGAWDPSLALVMAGAIAVSLPAFQWLKGRGESLLKGPLQLPTNTHIDRRLVIGGLLFGIGWGLAGFCPGPAIVASGAGQEKALVFTLAMLAGMGIFRLAAHKMIPARE